MDELLCGLNPAQHSAVTSDASVLQVLAPPGSGKTKTLTARVAYLIDQRQLKPWNIIVCTFTVKAAKEMKERVKHLVGEKRAKQLQLGTFHSIALRYLKKYGHLLDLPKDFGIADSADSKAIVTRILKQHESPCTPAAVRARISSQKAQGVDSAAFATATKTADQKEFAEIYAKYDHALRVSKLLDYDDILLRCLDLLRNHPACVANIEAVLIDEFQDTNNIQYTLMSLFAQYQNNITIVGDPDQSIYGFRAAEIQNLARMKQRWSDTLTINLKENYRSTGAILHAAQKIIEQDTSRPQKSLQATHGLGLRPILRLLPSPLAEAEWLVSEVKRLQALSGGLLNPGDFAVLIRAASLSRVIESALGRAGIPYRMVGGTRFYSRIEVKLLVDYLRVVSQPEDDEAIQRTINVPARKVGDASVKVLLEQSQKKGVSLWKLILDIVQSRARQSVKLSDVAVKGLTAYANIILSAQSKVHSTEASQSLFFGLVEYVVKKTDIQNWLKQKYPDDCENRWANIEEVIAQAIEISDPTKLRSMMEENALPTDESSDASMEPTLSETLSLFLANVALSSSAEEVAEQNQEKLPQLTISTIHAAKGLEWPVVIIPACYDGSIPHSRAEDCDEERRLLYVGMTRAQATLYLSRPLQSVSREETRPTPFLTQPGLGCFFEEHGPSISRNTLVGLAKTLGRICPSIEEVVQCRKALKQDEDNYWPLNGELPEDALIKLNFGKVTASAMSTERHQTWSREPSWPTSTTRLETHTTMTSLSVGGIPGFASVATRYNELMEQSRPRMSVPHEENKPAASKSRPRGRNDQISSQPSIAKFFQGQEKPCSSLQVDKQEVILAQQLDITFGSSGPRKRPLDEITNLQSLSASRPFHKLRTAPVRPINCKVREAESSYVMLSSSPTEASLEDSAPHQCKSAESASSKSIATSTRPAVSLHTTSMQVAAPRRRTLGMRRSLQGWSARPAKRPGAG